MTSGHFHSIPISSITVHREGRQRRELTDIQNLADSIRRLGLINPITITRDNVLVAGERRLAACKVVGYTSVACQYIDELEPSTLRAIELEENIKRQQLEWQDECRAIREYHALRKSENPEWSLDDTASAIGLDAGHISKRIFVADNLHNPRVAAAPKYSVALGVVERAHARATDNLMASLAAPPPKREESIINTSFLEWAPDYTGPKFNLIHCDFPFGIGADKFNQGAAPLHGGYHDTEDVFFSLLHCLLSCTDRISTESCHIMFWFSMHYYQDILSAFSGSEWDIDPFPLVWVKSDNIGILPDPQRGPRRIYETALFGSRGDRKIVRAKSNAVSYPSERDIHMSIKPEPMLAHFFEMFVDSSTRLLDPTCGSGSALRAAERYGASYVIGLESNPEFAASARAALDKSRVEREPDAEEELFS